MTLLLLNTLKSSCAAHKRVQSDPHNDFQHAVKIFNQERVVFFRNMECPARHGAN